MRGRRGASNRAILRAPGGNAGGPALSVAPMLGTVLLVILLLMVIGALPAWPHSRSWGYYPSSGLGLVLVVVLILLLMGYI
jgi:hypothetical protein